MKRWIIVKKSTGEPTGLRISYPSDAICKNFCAADERPREVETAGPSGPFSDFVRPMFEATS